MAVAGAVDGGEVVLLNVASGAATSVRRVNTDLRGIFSLSLDGGLAVAGSIHDSIVAVINFAQPTPAATPFNPGVGTGVAVAVAGGRIAAGAVTATLVKLLTTGGGPIVSVTGVLSSITGIALSRFNVVVPTPTPRVAVNPTSLPFGPVAVCLSADKTLEIGNTGTAPLVVSSIATAPPFSVAPAGGATIQPGTKVSRTVTFKPSAVAPTSGSLAIKSNDPATPTVAVPLSGTGTPSPPPEIVPTSRNLIFGACLPDYFIAKRIHFRNLSPCNPLTITSISTGSPLFPLSRVNEIALPNASTLGPITLQPGANVAIFVFFAPPTAGAYSGTLSVTSNAATEPFMQIPISGVAVPPPPTSMCLLLDVSGTMAEPAFGGTKLDALKRSAQLFNDLIPLNAGDFAAGVAYTWDLRDGVTLGAVTPPHKIAVREFIARQTVRVEVSAAGEALLMGLRRLLNAPTSRQVLLLFSDGHDGAGEHETLTVDGIVPQVVLDGVEVYCVALGTPWNINYAALNHIAKATRGRVFGTDDPLLLHKNFVQVLADAFRMNMVGDPVHSLARGTVLAVKTPITRCERRVRFVCTWDDPGETVGFSISAPDGATYTPASVAQNRLVRFGQRPCTAFFDLQFPPIDEGEETFGPQVTGPWTLHLDGRRLNADRVRVTTAVIADSHLKLAFTELVTFEVTRAGRMALELRHEGELLAGAEVEATVREPLRSAQEIRSLAGVERWRVTADFDGQLAASTTPLALPTRVRQLSVVQQADSTYALRLPAVWRDGLYELEVRTRVRSCGGTAERYGSYFFAPAQALSGRLTTVSTAAPRGSQALSVRVTPRDRAGNLLGPGLLRKMSLTPPPGRAGAEATGPARRDLRVPPGPRPRRRLGPADADRRR